MWLQLSICRRLCFVGILFLIQLGQIHILAQENKPNKDLLQAEAEFQSGNWTKAFKIYQQLAKDNPNSLRAQIGMASCFVEKRDYPHAIATFLRAIELSPNQPRIQAALASTYFKNKQSNEASKWYQQAIQSSGVKAQLSWYLNLGLIEADLGNFERARQLYNVAVQLYPQSVPAYYNLGIVLLRQNRLDEADACFYATLELSPNFDPALFSRGEVAAKRSNLILAENFYRTAIQLKPEKASYAYAYAQTLLRQGKSQEGKRELQKSRRLKAEKHLRQAHDWAEQENWREARRRLQFAVEADPTFLIAIEDLVYLQAELGDLAGAEATLGVGLLHVPSWAPGYWERGKIRQRRLKITGAASDFRQAIVLSPEAVPPKISMAKLLLETETDLQAALELAQTAVDLEPTSEYQKIIVEIQKKIASLE